MQQILFKISNKIKQLAVICLVFELAFPLAIFAPVLTPVAHAGAGDPADADPKVVEALEKQDSARDEAYEATLNALEETIDGKRTRHPLDLWRLLDQDTVGMKNPERVNVGKLQFVIITPQGTERVVSESEANTAITSLPGSILELRFRGEVLNRFRAPIEAMAWVGGRYLVFTEAGGTERAGADGTWIQELSFIDFKKYRDRAGLGENGLLPVFKFYRKLEHLTSGAAAPATADLDIRGDVLHVSGHAVPTEALEVYSDAEQVLFNSSVNLSQPSFYEKAARTISDLGVFFEQYLQSTGEQLKQQGASTEEIQALFKKRQAQLQAQAAAAPAAFEAQEAARTAREKNEIAKSSFRPTVWNSYFNPAANQLLEIESLQVLGQFSPAPTTVDEDLNALLQKAADAEFKQKQKQTGFFNRVRLLWAKLTLPEPEGPSRLREALAYVSSGASRKSGGYAKAARALLSRDGMLDLAKSRVFQMGVGASTAFLTAAVFPEATGQFLYKGLEISRTVFEVALHRGAMVQELAQVSAHGTFGWIKSPSILSDAYLQPGMLPKLGIGLAAILTALYLALGVPHITVNSIKLAKDFKRTGVWNEFLAWLQVGRDLGPRAYQRALGMLAPAFIQRQQNEEKLYLKVQTDAEAAIQGEADAKGREFTPEQSAQVDTVLANVKKNDESFWLKPLNRLKETALYQRFLGKSEKQEMTLSGAMMHFFFSLASFTNSGYAYTHIWQSWFGLRTMLISPTQLITNLIYPQYSKIVAGTNGGLHPPTQYNGGLTPRLNHLARWLKGESFSDDLIQKWEETVLPFEAKIHKAAVHESFLAVAREFSKERQVLTELFSKSGITSVNDQALQGLSTEAKLFFRLHYEMLFESSMQAFVKDLLAQRDGGADAGRISRAVRAAGGNLEQIKVDTLDVLPQSPWLKLSDAEIASRMRERATAAPFVSRVREGTRAGYLSLAGLQVRLKHRNLRVYDPKTNSQIRRMRAVERQKNNPRAMARAVRSMIASNIVDKPMELAFAFLFLAGLSDPLLKPLQEQMFSDTSTFFLSKYEFWNGFVSSVIMGALGDVWVKLQQDEKNEGSFDEVPEGHERKYTFLQYYWRKFTDPNNTVWKNQMHYFELIVPNILPALPTFLLTNFLTLGRFDFDMWFMGYFMTSVIWTSGLALKIEQAFELSTGWFAKDIPAELRAHPNVQKYLATRTGQARIRFNFFYKIYENMLGYFWSTFGSVATPMAGTRALTRLVMPYGFTPTEWFARMAASLRESNWAPKPLVTAVDDCVYMLTNKYVGLLDPRTGEVFTKEQLPVGNALDRK